MKVTLWDDFAELFARTVKLDQEKYKILILGCARITKWGGIMFYICTLSSNNINIFEIKQ